jgi:hypothetical protein
VVLLFIMQVAVVAESIQPIPLILPVVPGVQEVAEQAEVG